MPNELILQRQRPAVIWEEKVPANGTKNFVFYLKKGQKVKIGYIEDNRHGSMDLGKFSIEEGFENCLGNGCRNVSKDYTSDAFIV